jgi:osmotically-inducible protein OsmY
MKFTKILMGLAIAVSVGMVSCKPKDADVKAAIETSVSSVAASVNGAAFDVKDGVATITGEAKDEASKAALATAVAAVKGVKSVVNNITIAAPPPPAPEAAASVDAATQQKVKDGLKDIQGVTVEFMGDKACLSGAISTKDRMKVMQMLAAAGVKSDVTKLTNK